MEAYTERDIIGALHKSHILMGKTLHFTERVKSASGHFIKAKDDWRVCLADAGNWAAEMLTFVSEPLRFHHYAKRSKDECLQKINDLIFHGEATWRTISGQRECERSVHGGKGYAPRFYTEDLTLAASAWPALIRAFQEQLPLR
jgi:hypothetical protein